RLPARPHPRQLDQPRPTGTHRGTHQPRPRHPRRIPAHRRTHPHHGAHPAHHRSPHHRATHPRHHHHLPHPAPHPAPHPTDQAAPARHHTHPDQLRWHYVTTPHRGQIIRLRT